MPDEANEGGLIAQLQERAKELSCLYKIEELFVDPDEPIANIFRNLVAVIPTGWQYPEACQARITVGDEAYASPGFIDTPWVHFAEIRVQSRPVGEICVSYREETPAGTHGPFLKEEIKLLNTIADRLGHFLLHQRLRVMFEDEARVIENGQATGRPEWAVALELLRKTDRDLLERIARKMLNSLCWSGFVDAEGLLQRYVQADGGPAGGETNRPRERRPRGEVKKLADDVFAIAGAHLSDAEILARVQKWINEDRIGALIRPLLRTHTSLQEFCDALRRLQYAGADAADLPQAASNGLLVSLLRHFFTHQLRFISIATRHVEVRDFFPLTENLVCPTESYGKLGGKSAGLFLASRIIERAAASDPELGNIRIPKTWYVASDALLAFVEYNNLEELYEQKYKPVEVVRQEYPRLIQVLKSSHFPADIVKGLSVALDDFGKVPMVVRSSGLLEDQLGAAFSGKYVSLFLANQGSKQERLEALLDAIAEIYASTFGPDPIEYRAARGLLDFHEEMGVIIQEVVGQRVGPYFFPAFAGVAVTNNEFRWSPRIKREDGLVRIVPGLGTRAVDRLADDYPILLVPGQPSLRVNVSADEVIRYSPKKIDLLNLEKNEFETADIQDVMAAHGEAYPAATSVFSVNRQGIFQRPLGMATDMTAADLVVTFEGLITATPFISRIRTILSTLEAGLDTPVDIEFASDGRDLFLLQCRPQAHSEDAVAVNIPEQIAPADLIFSASRYVSNGRVPDITHLVYVDPEAYADLTKQADLVAVGEAVGKLNKRLPKRQFILVGPGRWGSRGDIMLGVRVTYADISNTAMLIEVARRTGNYVPDLSFGTHFFQDLVETSIRYLPLYPDEEGGSLNEAWLRQAPNILADIVPELAHLAPVVRVIDIPSYSDERVLRVLMNADEDRAVGILTDLSVRVQVTRDRRHEAQSDDDNHWRWRLRMAEQIGRELDPERFGVVGLYVFGSAKNTTAGPASDIDLLVHVRGTAEQTDALRLWLEGWSASLAAMNHLRTGERRRGLLDVHIITDEDIANRDPYAAKINAVTDAARAIPLGGND